MMNDEKEMENICDRNSCDPETLHVEADRLMKMVLRQFGYDDGIDILEEQNIWYA